MTTFVDLCGRPALGGGRCELESGHEGKHLLSMPSGRPFRWSDEGQQKIIDSWRRD